MLCIGYGRVIPEMLSEAVLTIFSMVTGATFYALFIATSMAYILQIDSSKNHYNEKVCDAHNLPSYWSYGVRLTQGTLSEKATQYYACFDTSASGKTSRLLRCSVFLGWTDWLVASFVECRTCAYVIQLLAKKLSLPEGFAWERLAELLRVRRSAAWKGYGFQSWSWQLPC